MVVVELLAQLRQGETETRSQGCAALLRLVSSSSSSSNTELTTQEEQQYHRKEVNHLGGMEVLLEILVQEEDNAVCVDAAKIVLQLAQEGLGLQRLSALGGLTRLLFLLEELQENHNRSIHIEVQKTVVDIMLIFLSKHIDIITSVDMDMGMDIDRSVAKTVYDNELDAEDLTPLLALLTWPSTQEQDDVVVLEMRRTLLRTCRVLVEGNYLPEDIRLEVKDMILQELQTFVLTTACNGDDLIAMANELSAYLDG